MLMLAVAGETETDDSVFPGGGVGTCEVPVAPPHPVFAVRSERKKVKQ
jgi:hypothetical protein